MDKLENLIGDLLQIALHSANDKKVIMKLIMFFFCYKNAWDSASIWRRTLKTLPTNVYARASLLPTWPLLHRPTQHIIVCRMIGRPKKSCYSLISKGRLIAWKETSGLMCWQTWEYIKISMAWSGNVARQASWRVIRREELGVKSKEAGSKVASGLKQSCIISPLLFC